MLFYNVYSKVEKNSNMIELEATCGESFYGLNRGTKEWMKHALRSIGINSEVRNWKVLPLRCAYVSQYFNYQKGCWKDRWAECWNVKIWLNEIQLDFKNKLDEFPSQGTAYIDETFEEEDIAQENEIMACNSRVLIIVDYQLSEEDNSAKSEDLMGIIKRYWHGNVHMDIRKYQYGIWQFRILLEKDKAFPESLAIFDQILKDIELGHGVVNYQQRFAKFGVNFLGKPASFKSSDETPAHIVDFMKRLE